MHGLRIHPSSRSHLFHLLRVWLLCASFLHLLPRERGVLRPLVFSSDHIFALSPSSHKPASPSLPVPQTCTPYTPTSAFSPTTPARPQDLASISQCRWPPAKCRQRAHSRSRLPGLGCGGRWKLIWPRRPGCAFPGRCLHSRVCSSSARPSVASLYLPLQTTPKNSTPS